MNDSSNAAEAGPKPAASGLKWLVDLGPVLIFVGAYSFGGLLFATAVFMAATAVALAVSWAMEKRLAPMPIVTGVVVGVFGGLTLWLQDATFIKMKPTIVNLLFAAVIFAGLAIGRNPLKTLFDNVFSMPDEAWKTLAVRWGVFFVLLAFLNELVWRNASEAFWVQFKLFGLVPLTILFSASQAPFIMKHLPESQKH